MVKNSGTSRGIAVLETAVFLSLLLAFLSGGLSLWDYVRLSLLLEDTAESHLQENLVKSFRLTPGDGFFPVSEVNEDAVRKALSQLVSEVDSDLARKSPSFRTGTRRHYIIACYSISGIDPESGRDTGTVTSGCPSASGDLEAVHAEVRGKDLRSLLAEKAAESVSEEDPASIGALPDGTRRGNYLPGSVMVGLRIYTSLDGTAASLGASVFGHPPYLFHDRIVTLRGDMS